MKTLRSATFFLLLIAVPLNFQIFAQENLDNTVELGSIHIVY